MKRTQEALNSALLSLLEEKAFDQITIREIAAKAGVGYATFFRRYPDKEALLHDLAALEISELLAMAEPILYTVDSRASAQALCAYLWEHRKRWEALLTGGAAAHIERGVCSQSSAKCCGSVQQTILASGRPQRGLLRRGDDRDLGVVAEAERTAPGEANGGDSGSAGHHAEHRASRGRHT